jgi:uncharacterized protein involved in response to NO
MLAVLLVFASLLPAPVSAWTGLLLALLLLVRFAFWKPQLALRRLDIGIMYLGYLAIVAQLLLEFVALLAQPAWVGSLPMHVFTFGAMGLIIPAMLIRIVNGHTGRKVVFDRLDKAVLWIMIAGFVIRIVIPQIDPAGYLRWIDLAAACWFSLLRDSRMALHPVPAAAAHRRQGTLIAARAAKAASAAAPLDAASETESAAPASAQINWSAAMIHDR